MKSLARTRVRVAIVAALVLAGIPSGMWWLHSRPVTLPAPAGSHSVGRVEYDWVDQTRPETFGLGHDGHRELDVWIWYPASPAATRQAPAPYLPPAWLAAREQTQQPAFLAQLLTQDLAVVQAHAVLNAALDLQPAPFPVLIFQPGLGPIVPDYTALAEDLASRGYVVAGSTPTYSSAVVAFPDGHVARGTEAANVSDSATPAEAQLTLDRLVQIWAADNAFVLNQLVVLNQSDPDLRFAGHLDLSRVGVWGHSFGGAAAAETCRLDVRCKAGINLDGTPYGEVVRAGLDQPFMSLWSEPPSSSDPSWLQTTSDMRRMESRLGGDGYQLVVAGSRHFNFTDGSVFYEPFLKARGGLGSIDGARFLTIAGTYMGAFFDRYLMGQAEPLLVGLSTGYPEVQFLPR